MQQIALMNQQDLPLVTLHPGELFVAREPTIITTILGSCVSVCLHCPTNNIGAMCHGVLPTHNKKYRDNKKSFRFVESSVNYMIDVLTMSGTLSPTSNLVAKIFGGANVLPQIPKTNSQTDSIGSQNIEIARQVLAKRNISLAVEKVGGSEGCKIFFYSHTGEVYHKHLSRTTKAENDLCPEK